MVVKVLSARIRSQPHAMIASYVLAFLMLVVTLAHLFRFERMPETLFAYELPYLAIEHMHVLAACIVTVMVLSLPYLLRLPLSRLMRRFSLGAAWMTILTWMLLSVQAILHGDVRAVTDATTQLPMGWWYVLLWIGMAGLLLWVWSAESYDEEHPPRRRQKRRLTRSS